MANTGNFPSQMNLGAFVPTTDVYDAASIYSLDINSQEFKEFLVRLRQSINNVALSLNIKDSGYYVLPEFLNGQAFFQNPALSSNTPQAPALRQVFRKVVNFGALPNTGTKSVAHGIEVVSGYTFTRMYACSSDPIAFEFIPIPYASVTDAANISLRADATNVYITTGAFSSNFTVTYVVLEYIKQ